MSNKYEGYLICSDLDGTLFDRYGKVSDENATAIKLFQDNGGVFTIATGRLYSYLLRYTDRFIPNAQIGRAHV